jgi:carbamoyl-phosphate synthase/aspartate carbamoyltransferase/dihydroorotase
MNKLLKLPGLIDVHTHLRVPGGAHKEDFASGSAAALAGGITLILAMPNTNPPLATLPVLEETRQQAQRSIYCDVGLFAGASPAEVEQLPRLAGRAAALKIYLNETFGPLRVEDLPTLLACFQLWPRSKVIAMHAEGPHVAVGIGLATAFQRHVHFCHISRQAEIELIAAAKQRGLPVTCEVTPHHLFLTQADAPRLGPLGDMRPHLAEQEDQEALWAHLDSTIDCIATDHAPHTLAEKAASPPPPGVPGLETSLPLLLNAVKAQRLSLERLIALMHTNPKRIFNLPDQPQTYVEVDPTARYTISNDQLHTKCGWSPFAGLTVTGRVQRVVLRGQAVYDASRPNKETRILAQPGTGHLLP